MSTQCPTPGKKGYAKNEARRVLHRIWRRPQPGPMPTRIYPCACGKYHLTSKPYTPAEGKAA